MHELSAVLGILDTLINRCKEEGYNSIKSIRLRIGKASGISPDAIVFAFDTAKQGTIASSAELFIDMVPIGGFCDECRNDFEVDERLVLKCPICGSDSFKINKGYEMGIVEMETG